MKRANEEALVRLWALAEQGEVMRQALLSEVGSENAERMLEELSAQGFVVLEKETVALSPKGLPVAEQLIRRHRLAERLMHDVFQVDEAEMEKLACEFEHILSPEVTDSVCTFLGHPPTCPHGKPIPRGPCCRTFQREVRPLVTPLSELELGKEGKIVYITTQHHTRLDRLTSLGVVPGNRVRLHQKRPSVIIQIDETHIALDTDIAREIYVKRV